MNTTIPNRASDAGPDLHSLVPCRNCGRYGAPGRADETQPQGVTCSEPGCDTRLCASCEDDYRCFWCGKPFCLDHSRPNPVGSTRTRICSACEKYEDPA